MIIRSYANSFRNSTFASQSAKNPSAKFASMLKATKSIRSVRISSTVSSPKAENVVNAPKKPTDKKSTIWLCSGTER